MQGLLQNQRVLKKQRSDPIHTTVNKLRICLLRKKGVEVAEKRFCEAKTFGARGSSVKKGLL
jgi:hypothetical protein